MWLFFVAKRSSRAKKDGKHGSRALPLINMFDIGNCIRFIETFITLVSQSKTFFLWIIERCVLPDDNTTLTYMYIFGALGGHQSIINRQLRAAKRCWTLNTVHVVAHTERRQGNNTLRTAILQEEN